MKIKELAVEFLNSDEWLEALKSENCDEVAKLAMFAGMVGNRLCGKLEELRTEQIPPGHSVPIHSGSKYHRTIVGLDGGSSAVVDVYAVLKAFDVRCPASQHAIKKLLCAGIRGKGDAVQDLTEAGGSVTRAVEMAKNNAVVKWEESQK